MFLTRPLIQFTIFLEQIKIIRAFGLRFDNSLRITNNLCLVSYIFIWGLPGALPHRCNVCSLLIIMLSSVMQIKILSHHFSSSIMRNALPPAMYLMKTWIWIQPNYATDIVTEVLWSASTSPTTLTPRYVSCWMVLEKHVQSLWVLLAPRMKIARHQGQLTSPSQVPLQRFQVNWFKPLECFEWNYFSKYFVKKHFYCEILSKFKSLFPMFPVSLKTVKTAAFQISIKMFWHCNFWNKFIVNHQVVDSWF